MPQPPGDPDYFDKVNYVIDAWARPCDAPWYIYVSTLKPALLTAFITLITFGWDDVARGYFRPRGLGRRTGKKRRRGLARRIPRFPEIGEEIGKRLPGAEEVKGWKWHRAGKTLWRIDTAMQMVLFYWLVADVTIDLAYNFTSVLYETRWCQASNLGRFSYRRDDFQNIPGGLWWGLSYPDEDYEIWPPAWVFTYGISGPTGCTVGAGQSIKPLDAFAPPVQFAVRIAERHTGRVFNQSGPFITDPDGTGDLAHSGDVPPNVEFEVQVWHDGDWAQVGNSAVTGMQD